MADVIQTLFGITANPAEEVQDFRTKQAMDLGALYGAATANQYASPERQKAYIAKQAAQSGLVSRGVNAVAGLLGLQDPMLQKQAALEGIFSQTQQSLGANASDPTKLYPALIKNLMDNGLTQEAAQVNTVAQKAIPDYLVAQSSIKTDMAQAEKYKAEALKALREDDPKQKLFFELAKNSSPQAVARAINNGYDLALLDSPEKNQYSPLARQLIDAGFEYGSPEFIQKMNEGITADIAGKQRGGATEVNIRLGAQEKGLENYAKKVGESVAEADVNLVTRAETAPETISKLNTTLARINDPKAITGILSGVQTDVQRVLSTLGGKEAAKKVEATQVLDALLGSEVFGQIQALGIGARGMDTPAERDFIRNVISGTTQLAASSLAEMVKIRKNIEKRMIQRYNKKLQSGDLDNFQEFSGRSLQPIFDENSIEVNGVMFEVPPGLTQAQRDFFIKKVKEKGAK
jgi:hypothetical protein